jgi:1-acyl-sn-glycerol-3-phosphate acyltransferase
MTGWIVAGAALWGLLIGVGAWARASKFRPPEELEAPILYRVIQVYARLVHRLRVEGLEHAIEAQRAADAGRPVVVAPNHTAGIDPLLIQAPMRREVRWMMASDMRAPQLEWLWQIAGIIFVERSSRDARSLREGLRHLKGGGILGVFPEGHIERPPRTILPFKAGVGLLVRGSNALVLPVVVDGAPQADPAWASLTMTSRSTVRFLEPVEYDRKADAESIAADLRARMVEATGWPATDRAPIVINGLRLLVDIEGAYYDERTGERFTDDEVRAMVERAGASEEA